MMLFFLLFINRSVKISIKPREKKCCNSQVFVWKKIWTYLSCSIQHLFMWFLFLLYIYKDTIKFEDLFFPTRNSYHQHQVCYMEKIYYNWSYYYLGRIHIFFHLLSLVCRTHKKRELVVPFLTITMLRWYWCSSSFSFSVFSCISTFVHIPQYDVRRNIPLVFPTTFYFFFISLSFFLLICCIVAHSLVDLLVCSVACIYIRYHWECTDAEFSRCYYL